MTEERKDNHITIIAIVAIVGIVGIVLGMYGINKSSLSSDFVVDEEGNLVGGAGSNVWLWSNIRLCKDSDGGKDYSVKGQTCYGNICQTDICSNDKVTLTEYYCQNTRKIASTTYKCPNGCKDGACLENGYRFATWVCYDGYIETQGTETSCKSSETWLNTAKNSCDGRCNTDGNKCGVNSFEVSVECAIS